MSIRKKITSKPWLPMLIWIIGIILLWEIAATIVSVTKRTPENVLPHLYQIFGQIFSTKAVSSGKTATMLVLDSASKTLFRAAIGFITGTVLGFVLALIMKISKLAEKTIFPYLMLIQMVPILGMAPIILSITGDINTSRIVIAAILTFYPVATNTLAGFNAVEREKYDLMYSYAASKYTIYKKVLIPYSIPYFFTGLKISAPMAITASILVDTLQGDGGLGSMLSQSLKHAMSIYVFWLIVFFSAFIGIFSAYFMGFLEKAVLPHKRKIKIKRKDDTV
jgi:ABC-type nitrate/sulfonate/bicarbonate transport system, permease component